MYIKRDNRRCPARTGCGSAGITVAAGAAGKEPCDVWQTMGGSTPLARAYFPDQDYREGFCPQEALCSGTLFPELVK